MRAAAFPLFVYMDLKGAPSYQVLIVTQLPLLQVDRQNQHVRWKAIGTYMLVIAGTGSPAKGSRN